VGGERFATLGYWALGVALIAVVLVGFVPERGAVRPSLRGILMAIGSGIAIGTFFITIDQTSEESGVLPLLVNRVVNAAIMFAVLGVLALVGVARRRRRDEPRAERMPRPAASGVLKERIAPVQWVGLVLALTAAGMLAVA
ncbi:MAG: EamA/RhaT family transporter, partial [Agromyces sp.]|nr:EamA/RhaT family transporter [Agromyces sp.]